MAPGVAREPAPETRAAAALFAWDTLWFDAADLNLGRPVKLEAGGAGGVMVGVEVGGVGGRGGVGGEGEAG